MRFAATPSHCPISRDRSPNGAMAEIGRYDFAVLDVERGPTVVCCRLRNAASLSGRGEPEDEGLSRRRWHLDGYGPSGR